MLRKNQTGWFVDIRTAARSNTNLKYLDNSGYFEKILNQLKETKMRKLLMRILQMTKIKRNQTRNLKVKKNKKQSKTPKKLLKK